MAVRHERVIDTKGWYHSFGNINFSSSNRDSDLDFNPGTGSEGSPLTIMRMFGRMLFNGHGSTGDHGIVEIQIVDIDSGGTNAVTSIATIPIVIPSSGYEVVELDLKGMRKLTHDVDKIRLYDDSNTLAGVTGHAAFTVLVGKR
jgi:hypothetical protein